MIDFNLNKYLGTEEINSIVELFEVLTEKRYSRKDLGINSIKLNNWEKMRLIYPQRDNSNKWRKFSFDEFIWLKVIDELRDIGISIEKLQKIREEIEFGVKSFRYKDEESDKIVEIVPKKYAKLVSNIDRLEKQKAPDLTFVIENQISNFTMYLGVCIATRRELNIIVNNKGKYKIEFDNPYNIKEIINWSSFTLVNINNLLCEFIKNINFRPQLSNLQLINEDEEEVLNHLKKSNLKYLTIHLDSKKQIKYIDPKSKKRVGTEARFIDTIVKGGYQHIEYITKNDKSVSFNNRIRTKMR